MNTTICHNGKCLFFQIKIFTYSTAYRIELNIYPFLEDRVCKKRGKIPLNTNDFINLKFLKS